MAMRCIGVVMTLALLGCPPAGPTDRVPPTETPEPTPPPDPASPAEPSPCGPVGEAFDTHDWIPADAPAAASIRLDDPDLSAALGRLGEHTRTPGHGLPVPLSLSLSQWSWQVPTLAATLRQAGFQPAELVFVADPDAAHAWVWRSSCDLDEVLSRVSETWSMEHRRTVEAVVATARPAMDPDAPTFPYDLLLLPGERMALVPAGRASVVLTRFSAPMSTSALGGGPRQTAGRRLDELEPAPVRLVTLGMALLDPQAPDTAGDPRPLRVTADGVIDGRPGPEDGP